MIVRRLMDEDFLPFVIPSPEAWAFLRAVDSSKLTKLSPCIRDSRGSVVPSLVNFVLIVSLPNRWEGFLLWDFFRLAEKACIFVKSEGPASKCEKDRAPAPLE
jgi:hypothetical protein